MTKDILHKVKNTFLDKKFVRYAVIGFSGVAIDFVIYALLVKFAHFSPVIASIISVSIAILNNFVWNAFSNFKKKDRILRRFVKFYLTGCVGLALTVVIIFILHDLINLGPLLSKIISIPPVVALQFILNKRYTFGDHGAIPYKHLLDTVVLTLSGICLLLLILITISLTTLTGKGGGVQTASAIAITMSVMAILAVVMTALLVRKRLSVSTKIARILNRVSVLWALSIGTLVICSFYGDFSLLPGTDQAILFNGASPEWIRSSDWYLQNFPYQAGVALLFRLSNIIFGTTLLPLLVLNLIATCIIFFLVNKISQLLFNDNLIRSIVSILLIVVFPVTFMVTMVYGDTIGIALALSGVVLYIKYHNLSSHNYRQSALYLIGSMAIFSLMIIIKSSLLLIPLAIFAYELIHQITSSATIRTKGRYILISLVLLVVVPYVSQVLFTKIYLNHYDIPSDKGIPKIAWVAMGFQPSGTDNFNDFEKTSEKTTLQRPGVHNLYITWLFADKFPVDQTDGTRSADISEFSYKHILSSLTTFEEHPIYTIEFFSKKNAILWGDPFYGGTFLIPKQTNVFRNSINSNNSTYYTVVSSGIKINPSDNIASRIINWQISDDNGHRIRPNILSAIQTVVYFFALISIVSTLIIRKLQRNTTWIMLLYIFMFGFIFYNFWEAGARYTLVYYLLLLPVAAYGITNTPALFREIRFRIRSTKRK